MKQGSKEMCNFDWIMSEITPQDSKNHTKDFSDFQNQEAQPGLAPTIIFHPTEIMSEIFALTV